ncbi:unnamed protein product [Triticum turgidum subsp. durum]|uniref:Uncharacterized protein n=1 Tax=Triticum turgidum subsp. durum TaxID=4567 RepID=A0A9R1A5H9_TRITD|nr:unnamed protein product [Triticum turgidum subsp. durum]
MTAIEMKPLLPPSSSRPAKTSDTASIYTPSTGRSFALWPGRRRAGGWTPDAQAVTCKTNMVTSFVSALHFNEWSFFSTVLPSVRRRTTTSGWTTPAAVMQAACGCGRAPPPAQR